MRRWGPPNSGWQDRSDSPWQRSRKSAAIFDLISTPEASAKVDLPTVVQDDPKVKLQRTEAVLILSRGSLTTRKLAQLAGLADGTEARTLIRQLNQLYDQTDRAMRVEEVAGGYEILTRPQFAPYLRRLGHVPQTIRLSSPALETLAIVAYRQPVMRADIEAVRGVQSGELLRQLMERDLVRISGRSEELGRPYLYSTTKRFLQVFGLRNTEALPCADWFNEPDEEQSGNSAPDLESSEKESVVSSAIASDNLVAADEATTVVAIHPTDETAVANSPKSVVDDDEEDWSEEEDDDWDDEDDADDWDEDGDVEEADDADEDLDEDEDWEDEEFEEGEDDVDDDEDDADEVDGDWVEVDDEDGDEEWEDDDDIEEEEETGEWVDDEDDDDWSDDDE